jgi:hypothetical protein
MSEPSVNLIDQSIWERGVPYEAFTELRRTDPVHWHKEPDGPGFFALTLHEDIRAVSKDPTRFSSYAAGVSRLDVSDPVALAAYRSIVIAQDPPEEVTQFREKTTRARVMGSSEGPRRGRIALRGRPARISLPPPAAPSPQPTVSSDPCVILRP